MATKHGSPSGKKYIRKVSVTHVVNAPPGSTVNSVAVPGLLATDIVVPVNNFTGADENVYINWTRAGANLLNFGMANHTMVLFSASITFDLFIFSE